MPSFFTPTLPEDGIETFARNEPGAREKLLLLAHQLAAALETPGETIERLGWAEVKIRPIYQHLIANSPTA